MKILLASSEVHPYSKSGGLADMVGALAKFLARAGHQVGLVTPLYRGILERFPEIKPFDWNLDILLGNTHMKGGVFVHEAAPNLTIYFIDHQPFYNRAGLYNENNTDYPDNAERFIFFSKAVVHLARYLPWQPELVHVHDWQAGLVPALIKDHASRDGWNTAPPSCLTIHNLAYQGVFSAAKFTLTNLPPDFFQPDGVEFYRQLNCLKAGISYADLITTVSPRYAREITTELFGCGLDGTLRRRQDSLIGVLNGVDYDEWNTASNPHLKQPFTIGSITGKAADKAELQKELGLPIAPNVPLFGTITRLAHQKGVDIELGALEEMLAANMQFVLLGTGGHEFEQGFRKLARRYPDKCVVKIGFDQGLSHRIEAGCDFYLMPSQFEPCGLNQMYSLRYGAIPIVRVTGGLDDSVTDASENEEKADGIKFTEFTVRALAKAIRKALFLYDDQELLRHYRENAMTKDFSWERTAKSYEDIYQRLLK